MKPDESLIEQLVDYLTFRHIQKVPGGNKLQISYFKEAEPIGWNYDPFDGEAVFGTGGTSPSDLDSKLDVSMITPMPSDNSISLRRFRQIEPEKFRGKTKRFLPLTIEMGVACLNEQGDRKGVGDIFYYSWDKNRWIINMPEFKEDEPKNKELSTQVIHIATHLQFYRRYQWRVALGYPGGGSVSFVTTPEGAKEAFKLRDIPEGKQRRTSLRNWIREHWRTIQKGEEFNDIKIRQHLRGATEFTWNGLNAKFYVPPFELERNEEFKAQG